MAEMDRLRAQGFAEAIALLDGKRYKPWWWAQAPNLPPYLDGFHRRLAADYLAAHQITPTIPTDCEHDDWDEPHPGVWICDGCGQVRKQLCRP